MDSPIFVDWLTIRQEYPEGGLPVVNGGRVWAVDGDGVVEWTTDQAIEVVGSYDTRLRLRCDGYRVELSGNVGRWGRADNLFGYGFAECVRRANEVLNLWNLPPFTRGELSFQYGSGRPEWTGAVCTRIDVTQNLCLWKREHAYTFLRYLGSRQKGRVKVGVSPDGASVMWGYGSRYMAMIAYDKAAELEKRAKRSGVAAEVLEFVRELGVVRIEAKLKTRFLTQRGLRHLAEVDQERLEQVFRAERDKVLIQEVQMDSFNEIPQPYRATAKDWRDGVNLREALHVRKFQRHRRALLKYGIDIAVPSAVKTLPPRVVELKPAALIAPDWYRRKYA